MAEEVETKRQRKGECGGEGGGHKERKEGEVRRGRRAEHGGEGG